MRSAGMESRHREGTDVIILGAGITGLSLALACRQRGLNAVVIEQGRAAGGAIQTRFQDGFLYEPGPNSILLKSPEVHGFLQQVGLREQLIPAADAAKKRFLVRNGRMLAMPSGVLSAIGTPLYTLPAKLRLLAEPFIGKCPHEDESVASFVTRRLGREFLDYGIAALVAGIWAGDPRQLSVRHAFPKVWNLEQKFGSLIRGSIGITRERKRTGTAKFPSIILSHPLGLSACVAHMARQVGDALKLGVAVTAINCAQEGWAVEWAEGRAVCSAPHLVITQPVHRWPYLPFSAGLRERLARLTGPPHVPVTTVFMGFRREQVAHPLDGFGVLIPPAENCPVLGVSFNSTLFPGRAPPGHVALTAFVGGALHPQAAVDDRSQLWSSLQPVLHRLLATSGEPVYWDHCHWPQAIPQYDMEHTLFLRQIQSVEHSYRGLHFIGNFRDGPGLNDCILSALNWCPT